MNTVGDWFFKSAPESHLQGGQKNGSSVNVLQWHDFSDYRNHIIYHFKQLLIMNTTAPQIGLFK